MGFQLGAVYVFEYIVSAGLAGKALPKTPPDVWHTKAFAILGVAYQVGVLLSRSSLSLFKVKRLSLLTTIQLINCVAWIGQDYFKWFGPAPLIVWMALVGLLGGAMYVNCFYQVLHDPEIQEEDREMVSNWVAISITAGIVTAAGMIYLLDETLLKHS